MKREQSVDDLAQKLCTYHILGHKIEKVEVILGFGTYDPRVAERAAELFLDGIAPIIVFSGGVGFPTKEPHQKSEAETFTEIAIEKGVPAEFIFIENRASNTGENVQYSKELLFERGINPRKVIIVQKPYMERRCFATFKKHWPKPEVLVTSPQIHYDYYCLPWLSKDEVINIIVGDFHKIMEYPKRGFQIHQTIPPDVLSAFEELVSLGYDKYLV